MHQISILNLSKALFLLIFRLARVNFVYEAFAKKRLLRKKFRKHLLSSFQKTKTTQTSGLVVAKRIEKVKKPKFEMELIKTVDCFFVGHGNYDGNLVSFRTKSL